MEAKDADGPHQDICHFMATASLISDKASSPRGHRVGEGGRRVSLSCGSAKQPSKSCSGCPPLPHFSFLKQRVPITADHMQSVPLIIVLGRNESCLRRVLTRGCMVISGRHRREFQHRVFSKYRASLSRRERMPHRNN